MFQYRKRYEVTCDDLKKKRKENESLKVSIPQAVWGHMWPRDLRSSKYADNPFQYRKRYEVTCDLDAHQ